MSQRWFVLPGLIGRVLCLIVPVQVYPIPSVSEGVLSEQGCFMGACLGGNQGENTEKSMNFFMKAQQNPSETQYLDQPADYGGEKGQRPFRHRYGDLLLPQ